MARLAGSYSTPNFPIKIIPTKIAWLIISRKSPMDMRIPPLKTKILLESNPLNSRILVQRLAKCIPMPNPKTVCRANLYNKIAQLEVCITFSGRGMGMNITAHTLRLGVTWTVFRRTITLFVNGSRCSWALRERCSCTVCHVCKWGCSWTMHFPSSAPCTASCMVCLLGHDCICLGCVYIYIYMHYVCVYVYIYIYIHTWLGLYMFVC